MEKPKENTQLPTGILYPETTDTEGVVELENKKKVNRFGFLLARNKRKNLHPTLERLLPYPVRRVYYDFSVGGYVFIFVLTFMTIIGVGILGAKVFNLLTA